MKILLSFIIMVSMSVSVRADTDDKTLMIQELVRVYGIDKMVNDAKSASVMHAEASVSEVVDQLKHGFPSLSDDTWEAIRDAAAEMIRAVEESWTAEEAIAVWETGYAQDFTSQELQQILDAVKTPLGQKQIVAGKRANSAMQQYLLTQGKAVVEEATRVYVAKIQQIVVQASPINKTQKEPKE